MLEVSVFCCQDNVLAASHRFAPLGQSCLQFQLVWHTACEIRGWSRARGLPPEQYSWLHLAAESGLWPQQGYTAHEGGKLGTGGAESGHAGLAFRACRGYGPNLGSCVRLDRWPSAPANQCEIGGDQSAQLLLKPNWYQASPVPQCLTDSASDSVQALQHQHSPYPSNADLGAPAARPGVNANPQRCLHQPLWR